MNPKLDEIFSIINGNTYAQDKDRVFTYIEFVKMFGYDNDPNIFITYYKEYVTRWAQIKHEEINITDEEFTSGDWIKGMAELYYDGPDPIGKTHIREGVVVRILNRPKFTAYKHKNFSFKVLEGIIKESATAPDMEEAQEVENE